MTPQTPSFEPLVFAAATEPPEPDEDETAGAIVETMRSIFETNEAGARFRAGGGPGLIAPSTRF